MLTRTTGWYLENIPTHAGFGPSWAIKKHINMWELDQTCWEVLLFFTNRISAQLGPKNQRFDLRAEAFYAPWRLQDADQCPATQQILKTTYLAKSLPPATGTERRLSSSEDRLASSVLQGFSDWKSYLNVMSCILSKSSPNVKLRRLLGKFTSLKGLVKIMNGWISRFEDHLAKELLACSGWAWSQTSSSEDPLAISLLPTSEWHFHIQMSSSEDPEGKHTSSSLPMKSEQNANLCTIWQAHVFRCPEWHHSGKSIPADHLATLWSPLGKFSFWRASCGKSPSLKPTWQAHFFQSLVEAKRQALKATWQAHPI